MGFEGFVGDNTDNEKFCFVKKDGTRDVWIFGSVQEKEDSLSFITMSNFYQRERELRKTQDNFVLNWLIIPDSILKTNTILFNASKFLKSSKNQSLEGWQSSINITEEIANNIITGLVELESLEFLSQIMPFVFVALNREKILNLWKCDETSSKIVMSFMKMKFHGPHLLERLMKKVIFIPVIEISLMLLNHLLNLYFVTLDETLEILSHDAVLAEIQEFCVSPDQKLTIDFIRRFKFIESDNFVSIGMMFFCLLFLEQKYENLDMIVLQTSWSVDSVIKNSNELIVIWSMIKLRLCYNCKQLSDVIICPLFSIIDKENDDPFQIGVELDNRVVDCFENLYKQKDALIPSWQFFWKLVHLKPFIKINAVSLITSTSLYCAEATKCTDIESKVVSCLSYRDSHLIRYINSESVSDLFENGFDRLGLFLCNKDERFFNQLQKQPEMVEKVLVTICRFTNKPMERCSNFVKKLAQIISNSTNSRQSDIMSDRSSTAIVSTDHQTEQQTTQNQYQEIKIDFTSEYDIIDDPEPTLTHQQHIESLPQPLPIQQFPHVNKSRRGTQSSNSNLLDRIMFQPKIMRQTQWMPYPQSQVRPFYDSSRQRQPLGYSDNQHKFGFHFDS